MRLFLVLMSTLFFQGCAQHPTVQPQVSFIQLKPIAQDRSVPVFNKVFAQGRMNVDLHTGYAKPKVIVNGDPRDLQQLSTRVIDNTLFVNIGKGYPRFGAVQVKILGHQLNAFTYQGVGTITGPRLNSSFLDLAINNQGKTTLNGNIYLNKLDVAGMGSVNINGVRSSNLFVRMSGKPRVQLIGVANISHLDLLGDGWFSMYWVKSERLTLRAKDGMFIQLAGITHTLDVELWGNARFKGRYLRAYRAFVKTHGRSVAELSAIKRQHTLASDGSDIYFYNIPEMKTDFMAYDGAVLDMRDWNVYALEEYTRYNK